MRRGFYSWDEAELPKAALEARCARLQRAMAREKLDGLALYTNIARPAAVSWLIGFTPYWSEGLLFVPPAGAPDFATALSKRVAEWMRAVTPVGALLTTPKPAEYFGRRLAASGARRLGVLELDMLPNVHAAELLDAAPEIELVDASQMFCAERIQRDDAERGLFAHTAVIAREALAQIDSAQNRNAFHMLGAVEKSARDNRAEDVQVSLAPDLGRDAGFVRVDRAGDIGAAFAIRASVAYKSTWVRRTRSVSTDPALAARFAALEATMDGAVARNDAGKNIGAQIVAALAQVSGAQLTSWSLEECRGSAPLQIVGGTGYGDVPGRACSVLTVHASVNGVNWVSSRPV